MLLINVVDRHDGQATWHGLYNEEEENIYTYTLLKCIFECSCNMKIFTELQNTVSVFIHQNNENKIL